MCYNNNVERQEIKIREVIKMITKEQAKGFAREKAEELQIERAKLVEDFCEETATPIIEEKAKAGEYSAVVGCNSHYASEIANVLRENGFIVRIDAINSKNSNLFVRWAD